MKNAMHEEYKFKGILRCKKSQRWADITQLLKEKKAKLFIIFLRDIQAIPQTQQNTFPRTHTRVNFPSSCTANKESVKFKM